MPILIAPTNQELKIVKILVDDIINKQLEETGVVVNAVITLLGKNEDKIVCMVNGGKIVLDTNVASKILVA